MDRCREGEKENVRNKCEGVRYNSTTNERKEDEKNGPRKWHCKKIKMTMQHADLEYVHSSGGPYGTVALRPRAPP
jgi:hypothetical protein